MKRIAIVLCLLVTAACSKRQTVAMTPSQADAPISMSANWIKPRGKRVDLQVTIANKSEKSVEIQPQDFQCFRDAEMGTLTHKFDNPPHYGSVRLAPSQSRTELVICNFPTAGNGVYSLKVAKLYESRDDGENGTKKLAEKLSWTFAPAK